MIKFLPVSCEKDTEVHNKIKANKSKLFFGFMNGF
jgi:hypothetical protein